MLAKTATKEPELLDGFNLEETLMTETTIDGEVMKESIIGEMGGGRRRSTRSTTKAIEAAAGDRPNVNGKENLKMQLRLFSHNFVENLFPQATLCKAARCAGCMPDLGCISTGANFQLV